MTRSQKIAARAGAAVLLIAAGAYAWFARNHTPRPAPHGVSTLSPSPSASAAAAPSLAPSNAPSSKPVVYVVSQNSGSAAGPQVVHGSGTGAVSTPSAEPLAPGATSIPAYSARAEAAYVPPPPIVKSSNSAPQIVSMSISTATVHSGQMVSGSVETSTNVASVEARIGGYSSSLHKVSAGKFALTYRVPWLPFFFRKTYTVVVIARNTRGEAVSTTFPITVR